MVEDVHAESFDGEGVEESAKCSGLVDESILVIGGRSREAEGGKVRSDDMVLL
jgi:hypothetical protein